MVVLNVSCPNTTKQENVKACAPELRVQDMLEPWGGSLRQNSRTSQAGGGRGDMAKDEVVLSASNMFEFEVTNVAGHREDHRLWWFFL